MNKETYLRLPNITVGELQNVIDYLEENNIKYVEYYENEHKLEQALDEIEKYIEEHKHLNWYVESCYKNDLLKIIKKAKGDIKNENNNV